jgi:ribosomal protein S27AE
VTPEQRAEALRLLTEEPDLSDSEVARRSGVERRTVSRWRAHVPADAPTEVSNVPARVPARRDAPTVMSTTWEVLGLSEREVTALAFYLAAKGRTIDGWLAELAGKVARDVLHLADRAQAVAVASAEKPTPLRARRCPTCGGHVLIDHGARCLTPGCGWTGKA